MKPEEIFKGGMNCSQSVFYPFAQKVFPDKDLIFKIMSPFGAGVAYTDRMCGAVTGAIAAIGLYLGHSNGEQQEQKAKCAEVTREFLKRFEEKFGSTKCTKLINYNLADDSEVAKAREAGVFKSICPGLVGQSADFVVDILKENGVKDISLD